MDGRKKEYFVLFCSSSIESWKIELNFKVIFQIPTWQVSLMEEPWVSVFIWAAPLARCWSNGNQPCSIYYRIDVPNLEEMQERIISWWLWAWWLTSLSMPIFCALSPLLVSVRDGTKNVYGMQLFLLLSVCPE